jgi:hypothetical protein
MVESLKGTTKLAPETFRELQPLFGGVCAAFVSAQIDACCS